MESHVSKHFKGVLLSEANRKDFEKWSNKLFKSFLNGPDSTADHFYKIIEDLLPIDEVLRMILHLILTLCKGGLSKIV